MNYISLLGIALLSIIPGLIARAKNRSFWGYYFLGYLVSPIVAIVIVIFIKKEADYSDPVLSNMYTCDKCGEKLIINANYCHKCGKARPKQGG